MKIFSPFWMRNAVNTSSSFTARLHASERILIIRLEYCEGQLFKALEFVLRSINVVAFHRQKCCWKPLKYYLQYSPNNFDFFFLDGDAAFCLMTERAVFGGQGLGALLFSFASLKEVFLLVSENLFRCFWNSQLRLPCKRRWVLHARSQDGGFQARIRGDGESIRWLRSLIHEPHLKIF